MKLAAVLLGSASDDCLAQPAQGAETLLNPEPDFYLLGSKSYGRNATFLMRSGWNQVAALFAPDGPVISSASSRPAARPATPRDRLPNRGS